MTTTALVLLGIGTVHQEPLLLLWNGSASAPLGFYARTSGPIARNDYVLSHLPASAQKIVEQRYYLPPAIPLLKRVAALHGDRVCRRGVDITVNAQVRATAKLSDSQRRPMPVWQGCHRLTGTELLLLLDNPNSFDGRYFGVTSTQLIIGTYQPLWTYEH